MKPVDNKGAQYDYCECLTRATIDDYVQLFREVYPDSEKLSSEYIEWLYCENPDGRVVGVDAYSEGSLVAHYATVPRRYVFHDQEILGLLSVNTATHPNHRGKGLFKLTAGKTYDIAAIEGASSLLVLQMINRFMRFKRRLALNHLVGCDCM